MRKLLWSIFLTFSLYFCYNTCVLADSGNRHSGSCQMDENSFVFVNSPGTETSQGYRSQSEDNTSSVKNDVQEKKQYSRYFNIAYGKQKLKYNDGDYALKSDYAVALTRGRTYFLHQKPLVGVLRFGLDWTVFDINFATYSEEYETGYRDETETIKLYQGEIGMHVGPSLTIIPIKGLQINGYFRYAPSFSCLYDEDFYYNYGSFFVSGAAIAYKTISLGVEGRWGKTKFDFGSEDEEYKVKMKTSGTRFYLSFRF